VFSGGLIQHSLLQEPHPDGCSCLRFVVSADSSQTAKREHVGASGWWVPADADADRVRVDDPDVALLQEHVECLRSAFVLLSQVPTRLSYQVVVGAQTVTPRWPVDTLRRHHRPIIQPAASHSEAMSASSTNTRGLSKPLPCASETASHTRTRPSRLCSSARVPPE
jgi:hypothetical protein